MAKGKTYIAGCTLHLPSPEGEKGTLKNEGEEVTADELEAAGQKAEDVELLVKSGALKEV